MNFFTAGLLMALATTTVLAIDKDSADALVPYCKLSNGQLAAADRFAVMMNADCFGIIAGVRSTLEQIHITQMTGRATLVYCTDVPVAVPLPPRGRDVHRSPSSGDTA
jgi:hypothetical protein